MSLRNDVGRRTCVNGDRHGATCRWANTFVRKSSEERADDRGGPLGPSPRANNEVRGPTRQRTSRRVISAIRDRPSLSLRRIRQTAREKRNQTDGGIRQQLQLVAGVALRLSPQLAENLGQRETAG